MSLDVSLSEMRMTEVYADNITHNLNKMADAAGLYKACWRPEEIGIKKASDLLPVLEAGLGRLLHEPEKFKAFNPDNGWGSYEGLVSFVRNYIEACRENPNAIIHADR